MDQAEVADRVGVSRQSISNIVNERQALSGNMRLKLASIFAVQGQDFYFLGNPGVNPSNAMPVEVLHQYVGLTPADRSCVNNLIRRLSR